MACLAASPIERESFTAALAADRGDAVVQVQVVELQADQLADAKAGGVQGLQDGPVAQPEAGVRGRCGEQPIDVRLVQEVRELAVELRARGARRPGSSGSSPGGTGSGTTIGRRRSRREIVVRA